MTGHPGEPRNKRAEDQDEQRFLARSHLGRIVSVDTRRGLAKVSLVQAGPPERDCPVVLGGLSVDGFRSSWRRYMPHRGSWVRVGFENDGTPFIIGPATYGMVEEAVAAGTFKVKSAGYTALKDARDKGGLGLNEWFELKEGEWHDRSSGGAAVFGSAGGQLTLSAGGVNVTLDKWRDETVASSGLYVFQSGASFARLGDQKVLIPPGLTEVATPPTTGLSSGKQWHLRVADLGAGAVELPRYEERIGDVRETTDPTHATPQLGPILQTQVERTLFEPLTEAVLYQERIDAAGNRDVTAANGLASSRFLRDTIDSKLQTAIASDTLVTLGNSNPAVARHPIVRGEVLLTALLPWIAAVQAVAMATVPTLPGTPAEKSALESALTAAMKTITDLLITPAPEGAVPLPPVLSPKVLTE